MVKKINFWVKNRRGLRNLLVITCLILFLSSMYRVWWLKCEADSINKIETKLEWDGYDQNGDYIEDRQYKINSSRQENKFPNPIFKPYSVEVEDMSEGIVIQTTNNKIYRLFNGKGLSFDLNSNLEISNNQNLIEKSEGQAELFLEEHKQEIQSLLEVSDEYYKKINT
ncbi:hypothetical protein [Vagococcus hydrophili]|uniref:Uncharacterized protein n=1 Tax=Vagococcus hydrophili TaxID=2714947 RepID=A0A6G8AT59_9ENTE|nr:hypothetical protein [Vagococcus hydrophili]QIL48186.1 hypothetical protein G7082_06625 [Vagococcus hydrophili]